MEAIYPLRFEAGDKAAEAFFHENGSAVFKDVATADELKRGEDLFWAWMEESTDVVRDDLSTWSNHQWPGYTGLGIINSNGVGQIEFLWFVRGLRTIHTLFSDLWHDDDLISSFDGCDAFSPIQKNPEWTTKTGWFHCLFSSSSKKKKKLVDPLDLVDLDHDDDLDLHLVDLDLHLDHLDLVHPPNSQSKKKKKKKKKRTRTDTASQG
jgi:hypothetical protein